MFLLWPLRKLLAANTLRRVLQEERGVVFERVTVVKLDSSLRFVRDSIAIIQWRGLPTRDEGEVGGE